MLNEPTMAKRKKTAYLGDVGEVEVVLELLNLGTAVHVITGSDYGWDLHVQVPLRPTPVAAVEGKDGWSMSGRAAHIQVKKKSKSASPSVDPGSIRGWLSGSEVGVPSFVFIVVPDGKYYLSPHHLRVILKDWELANAKKRGEGKKEVGSVTLSLSKARQYKPDEFSWLLHLWTSYPGVMFRSSIEEWTGLGKADLYQAAYQFIFDVVLAWMKSHFSDIYLGPGAHGVLKARGASVGKGLTDAGSEDPGAHEERIDFIEAIQGMDALGIAQAAFVTMYPDKLPTSDDIHELSWGILRALEQAIYAGDGRWPKADLMTSYSVSPDIGRSRDDAIELVRDVISYYNKCLAWCG